MQRPDKLECVVCNWCHKGMREMGLEEAVWKVEMSAKFCDVYRCAKSFGSRQKTKC